MKIEKTSTPSPVTAGESSLRTSTRPANGESQPSDASSTSVHLGATSAQLQSMENSMASSPLVNAAKVAEIKQAISEGRFQVNSSLVADSLIKSVTDLIKSHKA